MIKCHFYSFSIFTIPYDVSVEPLKKVRVIHCSFAITFNLLGGTPLIELLPLIDHLPWFLFSTFYFFFFSFFEESFKLDFSHIIILLFGLRLLFSLNFLLFLLLVISHFLIPAILSNFADLKRVRIFLLP